MNKFFQSLVKYPLSQVVLFSLLIGAGYYYLVFDDGSALQGDISSLEREIKEEETKRGDTESTLKEETRMKEALTVLTQQYQELSRKLPASLTSIDINKNIDIFARNSGTSIKSRRPDPVVHREIIDEVPVVVSLEGGFSELAQFLYFVSASERVTALRRFVITPTDVKSTRLRMEGTILGYKLAEDKTPAKEGKAQ